MSAARAWCSPNSQEFAVNSLKGSGPEKAGFGFMELMVGRDWEHPFFLSPEQDTYYNIPSLAVILRQIDFSRISHRP